MDDTEQAFLHLHLSSLTSLFGNPEFGLPVILQMDASETMLGAVLSQKFEEEEHPVLFISRKLTTAEKNAAMEQEAHAIKWANEDLARRHFTPVTDHAPPTVDVQCKGHNCPDNSMVSLVVSVSFQVQHRAGS